MMNSTMVPDLDLPEQEFRYAAGPKERPWDHFTGRWRAMQPRLQKICESLASDRPLRIVDVGSCTGFFSLQAAHQHPDADVIAVEGSVGIGNGAAGMDGSTRQILQTPAVQTHLRWVKRLNLSNCLIAPEVWDYTRIVELASQKRPICDIMLSLSVIHHIEGVSTQQFANAGLSRLDGIIETIARLLSLAPYHFVELPYKPWLAPAYDAYGSQRGILEAAVKASEYEWEFVGPLYNAEWFGPRDLWLIQAKRKMLPVDLNMNPFRLLYGGDDATTEPWEDEDVPPAHASVLSNMSAYAAGVKNNNAGTVLFTAAGGMADPLVDATSLAHQLGGLSDSSLSPLVSAQYASGLLMDPAVTAMCLEPSDPVEPGIGDLLQKAPTPLLVAHLSLREAITEAETLIRELASTRLLKEGQAAQAMQRSDGVANRSGAVQVGGAGMRHSKAVHAA
mmetsp:Transcript_28499/g.52090  ORF Transcript_28499/g.52090 Transcript_28499/m.52090 type:complete len:448 (+) Transcript_28499:185-1528(+)